MHSVKQVTRSVRLRICGHVSMVATKTVCSLWAQHSIQIVPGQIYQYLVPMIEYHPGNTFHHSQLVIYLEWRCWDTLSTTGKLYLLSFEYRQTVRVNADLTWAGYREKGRERERDVGNKTVEKQTVWIVVYDWIIVCSFLWQCQYFKCWPGKSLIENTSELYITRSSCSDRGSISQAVSCS